MVIGQYSVECTYYDNGKFTKNYSCLLENLSIERDHPILNIEGEHLPDKFDGDVFNIVIEKSNIYSIPQELFNKFRNITTYTAINCKLKLLRTLKNCDKLETIDLSYNDLEIIEEGVLDNCAMLRTIFLNYNRIQTFMNPRILNIKSLHIKNNLLTSIEKEIFVLEDRFMVFIDFSFNQIQKIYVFESCQSLNTVNLSHNYLNYLSNGVFGLCSMLETLDLSSNRIIYLTANTFGKLSNLRNLYLQDNPLEQIEDDSFVNFKLLQILKICGTNLTKFPEVLFDSIKNLIEFEFCNNFQIRITEEFFSGLQKLFRLQTVNLEGNQIEYLEKVTRWFNQYSTQYISMSNNSLAEFPRDVPENLILYNFGNNKIRKIPHDLFKETQFLFSGNVNISNNLINEIENGTFWNLNRLSYIDLSGNHLKSIKNYHFVKLNDLLELFLAKNKISSIEEEAFSTLPNLQIIDLSYNKVVYIQEKLFSRNSKLEYVNLSYNYITKIDPKCFSSFCVYSKIVNLHQNFCINETFAINCQNSVMIEEILAKCNHDYIECSFEITMSRKYECNLIGVSIENSNDRLYFGGNHVGEVKNSNVRVVIFENSQLATINNGIFLSFLYLEELVARKCGITELTKFESCNELHDLFLDGNQLKIIKEDTFDNCGNLQTISLISNELSLLKSSKIFYNLHNLQFLYLCNNNIVEIVENLFETNLKLREICLSSNNISKIHQNVFNGLRMLHYIALMDNFCVNENFQIENETSDRFNRELLNCF